MQTYSHALISAALDRHYGDKSPVKVDSWSLIAGSFLPDLPLFMLTLWYFAQRFWFSDAAPSEEIFGMEYDALYFGDPLWIVGHSMMHAPLMIALYIVVGYWFGVRGEQKWARMLFWFGIGCGLHSFVDILTHHNDGPLLLFPLDWQVRFPSPISYWDPEHGGTIFTIFEHLLDLGIIGYLVYRRLQTRRSQNTP